MHIRHAIRTDVGRVREHNEDSSFADPDARLFVVCDGMGGRAAGEVASRMAVDAIRGCVAAGSAVIEEFAADGGRAKAAAVSAMLQESVVSAAQQVFAASLESADRRGMGTTLTALLFAGHRAFVVHVGDSRAYLVRGGRATQITRDHSLIDELVLAGHLTREEAASPDLDRLRCVLARAVGVANEVNVDAADLEVLPGDQFLLCSDGLSHYVGEDEIAAHMLGSLEASVEEFVGLACDRGGHDNITALAVRCESSAPSDVERLRLAERRAQALAAIPLFRELDPRQFVHVLLAAETLEAPAGTVLVREDQPLPALFVVLEGRVRLARAGSPGEEAGPGRWFGDAALVDRWVAAPTATAVEPSLLVRLTRDDLVAVARREPEVSSRIVAGFARAAADRMRPGLHR